MAYSVSVSKGKGNLRHNERTQDKLPEYVDPDRVDRNINLVDWRELVELDDEIPPAELTREAVDMILDQIFNPSIERCRPLWSKRVRDERPQTGSEWIRKGKSKPFHELIIQVGNMDECPDDDKAVEIFKDFLEQFKMDHPDVLVIGAYIHLDESTPHMHVDYIPLRVKDVFERDSNGNLIYEKTPTGKKTKRPQRKYIRDENGNIVYKKHFIKGKVVMKPKVIQFRDLDISVNHDKCMFQNIDKELTPEQLREWKKLPSKKRFKYWRNVVMANKLKGICHSHGLETKDVYTEHEHVHHTRYKEIMKKATKDAELIIDQAKKEAEEIVEEATIQAQATMVRKIEYEKTVRKLARKEKQLKESVSDLQTQCDQIIAETEADVAEKENRLQKIMADFKEWIIQTKPIETLLDMVKRIREAKAVVEEKQPVSNDWIRYKELSAMSGEELRRKGLLKERFQLQRKLAGKTPPKDFGLEK